VKAVKNPMEGLKTGGLGESKQTARSNVGAAAREEVVGVHVDTRAVAEPFQDTKELLRQFGVVNKAGAWAEMLMQTCWERKRAGATGTQFWTRSWSAMGAVVQDESANTARERRATAAASQRRSSASRHLNFNQS
jgi:hypothetical protein